MFTEDQACDCRYLEVLKIAENFGQPSCIIGFEARIYASNALATNLINQHPAFLNCNKTLTLENRRRNRELVRCLNASLFLQRISYFRIDNGCDETAVTSIIHPISGLNDCGLRQKTQLAYLKIQTIKNHPPLIRPLQASHNLTPRQIDILRPFCTDYSIQNAGCAIGVSHQRAREMFCDIYCRLGVSGKQELIAFLSKLPCDPDP